jgi:AraC family transcriptional regulator
VGGSDRVQDRQPRDGLSSNMVRPIVEISPPESVERRAASWPGMAAEIVQVTRSDRIESRFRGPLHLLAVYEGGVRHAGETFVEGLPGSTVRDLTRELVFVPAGHAYWSWQVSRVRSRIAYFYFDPAAFAINADVSVTDQPFSPRLFMEADELWDLAFRLTRSIEGDGSLHRPYVEALGLLMAHELIRLQIGKPAAKPEFRGGLAAWQERTVVAYIEEHVAEPISVDKLAQLARLSRYHFSRAFKQSFGQPPHRFHARRRIERAKVLLATSAQSVTEIGLTMGFSETSSFSTAFRRETGMAPSSYRRSLV